MTTKDIPFGDLTTVAIVPKNWSVEVYEDGKTVVFPSNQDLAFLWMSTVSAEINDKLNYRPSEDFEHLETQKNGYQITKLSDRIIASYSTKSFRDGCNLISHQYTIRPMRLYNGRVYDAILTLSLKEPDKHVDKVDEMLHITKKIVESIIFSENVNQRVLPLSDKDITQLDEQRNIIEAYLADGARLKNKTSPEKLGLLDDLLEGKYFAADQTYELQSMGVVLGDVFAKELGMNWVSVEDSYGKTCAVKHGDTSIILYPITMISKRVERGENVDVYELYNDIAAKIDEIKEKAD